MDKVSKTFQMKTELYEKLKTLQIEKSFSTISATLHFCISDAYDRQMRNEKRIKMAGVADDKLNVDERRKEREEERCKKIAKALDGKLVKSGDGYVVEYFNHSKQGSYKQVLPLLSLTEDLIDKQWFPSKEAVLEARKINE